MKNCESQPAGWFAAISKIVYFSEKLVLTVKTHTFFIIIGFLAISMVNHIYHCVVCYSQHGFLKQPSILTNLLEYIQFMGQEIDSGGQVDAVYIDLCKAFSPNYFIYLVKLFQSYLLDLPFFSVFLQMFRRVLIWDHFFLLLVNDICKSLSANALLFTHD